MADQQDEKSPDRDGAASALSRLPTGAKAFMILSIALLPLALIALFSTLQTTRTADIEARSRLRVAVTESSRALSIELVGDMTALRVALQALDADPDNRPSCARVKGVFAEQNAAGTRFAIIDSGGRIVCGESLGVPVSAAAEPGRIVATLIADRGLELAIAGDNGSRAVAFFPQDFLAGVARPTGFVPAYASTLSKGDEHLALSMIDDGGPLSRLEQMSADLQLDGMTIDMAVRGAPITSPVLLAMMLPLLMWIAAAGIAWFVVDRLLVRPLRRLSASVRDYEPGGDFDPVSHGPLPAQEIRELGDTFSEMARTVRLHEADLAAGLVRQTKLTREVHHRVKNNLQVIASLINFHARGSTSPDASAAYASIQRRVDALAVVHRYHFAELEENRGLELRPVIGELASNIRATASETAPSLGITLDVEQFLVTQDVAVAVAFLLTEMIELAMSCSPAAQIRISLNSDPKDETRAVLRVSSPALVESAQLAALLEQRYGRVIGGLVRQLRSQLHHDPLVGAYEVSIAITGRA